MRFFRILSLIFVFAALFFGGAQLFFHMRHTSTDLTVGSLLENAAIDPGGLVSHMPGSTVQELAAVVMQVPAWLAALCLAGAFWLAGNALGGED
jgi:hypothetical protein